MVGLCFVAFSVQRDSAESHNEAKVTMLGTWALTLFIVGMNDKQIEETVTGLVREGL